MLCITFIILQNKVMIIIFIKPLIVLIWSGPSTLLRGPPPPPTYEAAPPPSSYLVVCFLSCAGEVYTVRHYTVQITFIFIGQTHLVFGKRVCTCATKHSNAFRTFLNWLKNSKRVWHEPKLHIMRVPLFANFDL